MKQIVFDNVVPEVFAQKDELHSEIWRTHISFDKGKTYLVEADSGMGKSTFCSYIVGYRNDYSGTIRFDEPSASQNGQTFAVNTSAICSKSCASSQS